MLLNGSVAAGADKELLGHVRIVEHAFIKERALIKRQRSFLVVVVGDLNEAGTGRLCEFGCFARKPELSQRIVFNIVSDGHGCLADVVIIGKLITGGIGAVCEVKGVEVDGLCELDHLSVVFPNVAVVTCSCSPGQVLTTGDSKVSEEAELRIVLIPDILGMDL